MNNEIIELKLNEHNAKLDNHESRIGNLEKSDIRQESQIGMLCEKIKKLIDNNNKWFWLAVSTIIGIFTAIFISKMGW